MDRQKKILIIVGAWISAALLSWFVYAKAVAPQTEPMKAVVVASRDMSMGTLLGDRDLKLVKYPERDVPKGAVFEAVQAKGRVILSPMYQNEPVLISKLSAPNATEGVPSTIRKGYRAVSVPITDANGVAGLIQPNAHVDVLFTKPGNMAEAITTTILRNVTVLSTGHQTPSGQAPDNRTPRSPVVTLVLTPAEAQKLELAKNQGRISLSLRNPQDDDDRGAPAEAPITTEALDPHINARLALAKKGRVGGKAALEDPNLWQELTGTKKKEEPPKKEPEKPRAVIDVYRGDKHVQELFK